MSLRNNIVPMGSIEPSKASNRQKYSVDMCPDIIAFASAGQFPEEWCAELGISMRTLYVWANKYPEFEETVEMAWIYLHAYWSRFLRENIAQPRLKQTLLLKLLAKRFPSTWGSNPINTYEHFISRIDAPVESDPNCRCAEISAMSSDELIEQIAVLQKRRELDGTFPAGDAN